MRFLNFQQAMLNLLPPHWAKTSFRHTQALILSPEKSPNAIRSAPLLVHHSPLSKRVWPLDLATYWGPRTHWPTNPFLVVYVIIPMLPWLVLSTLSQHWRALYELANSVKVISVSIRMLLFEPRMRNPLAETLLFCLWLVCPSVSLQVPAHEQVLFLYLPPP